MSGLPEIYTGEVSSLAFGGQGIIRHEGLVVFIPFTAIGDKVSYRLIKRKKNFAVGEVIDILHHSPQRTLPLCPYFGTCGGCQLQHIKYADQLSAKRQWIEDAIQRQAGLKDVKVPPVIASQRQWAYRRKITLTLRPNAGHFIAGYITANQSGLIEVEQCPIFAPTGDPIIAHVQAIAHELICPDENEGKATLLKAGPIEYLLHLHFKNLPSNTKNVIEKALENIPEIKAVVASSPQQTLQAGHFATSLEIETLHFDFSPQAFIQNHPEQSLNIYRAVNEITEELRPKKTLDLYCGIGISSLLLAKQGSAVIGVEANSAAVRLAKANAKKNNLIHTKFIQAYVEDVLEELLIKDKPDLVIANPPREGLAQEAVQQILKAPPPKLIYISCMPSTLARDIKPLCAAGYRVETIQGYDMFPQTTHVETLVVLNYAL